MHRRRIWPFIRRIWITLGVSATAGFVGWSVVAYRATSEARSAARSDALVTVSKTGAVWRFVPNGRPAVGPTFVFYPGALVDPRAYAPLARAVTEASYQVIMIELPRRGAFGGADSPELAARTNSVLASERGIVVGGHSRGAVVASRLASRALPAVRGLVLIGTSHPRDQDLSSLTIPITKIVGTRDGLATPDEVHENASLLPRHTRWLWIEGGNHSQFGWYGFQPLDRRPGVDASVQRSVMIQGVLDILRSAGNAPMATPSSPIALADDPGRIPGRNIDSLRSQ